MRAHRAAALVPLLAFLGCPVDPDKNDKRYEPVLPTVTVEPANPVIAVLGKPVTLTARLTDASGAPAAGYTWEWLTQVNSRPTLVPGSPSPGVETLAYTPNDQGTFTVYGRVKVCAGPADNPCFAESSLDTPFIKVTAWGGAADAVYTAQPAMSLVVGEERPLGALAVAWGGQTASDDPMLYASADTQVARVEADGTVVAVALGSTRITASAGTASAGVDVQVVAGVAARPPPGLSQVSAGRREWLLSQGIGTGALPWAVTTDSRGYPYAVLNTLHSGPDGGQLWVGSVMAGSTPFAQAGLMRWTGSGFGHELAPEPFDVHVDPQVTIDSRDHLYLLYGSGNHGVPTIAERPLASRPGSERLRRLPVDLAEPRSLGFDPKRYVIHADDDRMAVMPRTGGGVWVGYTVTAQYDTEYFQKSGATLPQQCQLAFLVAEVTDAEVKVRQVQSVFFPLGRSCAWHFKDDESPKYLLAQANFDGGEPFFAYEQFFSTVEQHYAAYSLPTPDDRKELPDGGAVGFGVNQIRESPTTYFVYGSFNANGRIVAIREDLKDYLSVDMRGGVFQESLLPELGFHELDNPPPAADLAGYGLSGGRFHLLLSEGVPAPLNLAIARLPRSVSWAADETQGRRFTHWPHPPVVTQPPVVLSDGTRFVLSGDQSIPRCPGQEEIEAQGLYRSSGPGDRFELLTPRGNELQWRLGLRAVGDTLVTQSFGTTGLGFSTRVSSDRGLTWTKTGELGSPDPASRLRVFEVLQGGAGFAVMSAEPTVNFEPGYTPDVRSPAAWVSLPGLSAVQRPNYGLPQGFPLGSPYGLVADGTSMWLLASLMQNGGYALLVRRYSATGVLQQEFIVPTPKQAIGSTATIAANGSLVMLWREPGRYRYAAGALAVNPTTRAVTLSTFAADGFGRLPPLLRLSDGRVVFGGQYAAKRDQDRAVLSSSMDGVSWTALRELRPEGGNGQNVWALGAEPDGHVLAFVGDNGAWRPERAWDIDFVPLPVGTDCQWMKLPAAVMRVAVP